MKILSWKFVGNFKYFALMEVHLTYPEHYLLNLLKILLHLKNSMESRFVATVVWDVVSGGNSKHSENSSRLCQVILSNLYEQNETISLYRVDHKFGNALFWWLRVSWWKEWNISWLKWKIHSKASKWLHLCFGAMSNVGVRWYLTHQKNCQNRCEWNCCL